MDVNIRARKNVSPASVVVFPSHEYKVVSPPFCTITYFTGPCLSLMDNETHLDQAIKALGNSNKHSFLILCQTCHRWEPFELHAEMANKRSQ